MITPLLDGEKEKLVFRSVHRRSDRSQYPVEIHLQAVTHAGEAVFMAVTLDITERKKAEDDRERLLALEQAARAKAEEAETRAQFLAEASGSLVSTLDYEATLRNIARAAVPTIADWCAVHMVNPSGDARVVALEHADLAKLNIASELTERYPESTDSPFGVTAVLRTGQAQLYPDFSDQFLTAIARDAGHLELLRSLSLSSAMIVPLIANERTLGSITLIAAESGRHFTNADLPFAEDLAARAATAAENARLYQELRHANAAKDHFIAVLSHELRTPLNPVLMTVADLEGDQDVPSSIREQLTVVRRNVELEARLIDDLLDSTRIASGKLQLYRTIVDATELIRRAVAIVEGEAQAKGVRLDIRICAQPCPVDADPARLQQVIWNVVKNAVKFTHDGGLVRLSCQIEPPGWIRVKVEDNGIGIEAEYLGKIFNAFEQGDLRTGHRFGGLGLGLAISKALVTLHGGSLIAQSAGSGLGATFTIELPLAIPRLVAPISGPLPSPSRRSLRLLLVEDHEATSTVMIRLLTKRGYDVSAAASIREALLRLQETPFDLLVSDLGLPDGTGHELMEKVRAKQSLPGIALSGYGTEADIAQSTAVGFSIHLTKPVDINRLDYEIQALFSNTAS
jgi:signal transduction histidine kinase